MLVRNVTEIVTRDRLKYLGMLKKGINSGGLASMSHKFSCVTGSSVYW